MAFIIIFFYSALRLFVQLVSQAESIKPVKTSITNDEEAVSAIPDT